MDEDEEAEVAAAGVLEFSGRAGADRTDGWLMYVADVLGVTGLRAAWAAVGKLIWQRWEFGSKTTLTFLWK